MQIKNDKTIAILLSTYNGERYLIELLDSIMRQTSEDYTLYIRDDGSSDRSVVIAKEYASKFCNIIIIPYNDVNHGAHYSFLAMMDMVESDYYMFCDQDDIWLPTKVDDTFNKMKESECNFPNTPIVIHTDLKAVDGNLNLISDSFWSFRGFDVDLPHTFQYICHYNDVTGCTMMINRLAKQACHGIMDLLFPEFMYYDNMICIMTTKAHGKVIPLKKQTIIYRRHGNNETDALILGNSITTQLSDCGKYYKQQKQRYNFFKKIGYGSFEKFLYYKIKLYFLRQWRKKHD